MKPEADLPCKPDGDKSTLNLFVTFDTEQSEIPSEDPVKTPPHKDNVEARKRKPSPMVKKETNLGQLVSRKLATV